MIAMDISSATSSLFSSGSRYGDQKKSSGDAGNFLAMLNGSANALSSLHVVVSEIDGLPVEKETKPDGLPVEKDVKLDGLPVEPDTEIDGLPVEPSDPYVDPQILLTQKLAASLIGGGGWWTIDPPSAAAA